ncbi:hypothetical protein BC941DRAFT_444392 [Chlamydoabsidia padenii]|nr:hypothetical protein BC941DRAFT_444392 [Chlamydoabsidia padenii]
MERLFDSVGLDLVAILATTNPRGLVVALLSTVLLLLDFGCQRTSLVFMICTFTHFIFLPGKDTI